MDLKRLQHRLDSNSRIRSTLLVLKRINRRTRQKQNIRSEAAPFGVPEVRANVALVKRTRPDNHGWIDIWQRLRKNLFRRQPLRSIGQKKGCARTYRSGLTEINAVKPREQINDFAPDGSGFYANSRIVSVDDWRSLPFPGGLPYHANGSSC